MAAGVAKDKWLVDEGNREYGRGRAATLGALVDTANRRLLKLRGGISTDDLLSRVLSLPKQEIELRLPSRQ